LARARELASEYRDGLAKGVSPLERREAEQRARDGKKTFGACADALLDAKSSEWRNAKHRAQWKMTLEEYAKPLRALPVDGVTTEAVLSVLQPIWPSVPETASRLRGRIEAVLDYAKAHGWRTGENPAAWRGHLALIFPGARSSHADIMRRCLSMTCRHSSASCASGKQQRRWPWNLPS
jgi:hypothetical protein